jgi:hypothetical protein
VVPLGGVGTLEAGRRMGFAALMGPDWYRGGHGSCSQATALWIAPAALVLVDDGGTVGRRIPHGRGVDGP